MEHLKFEFEEGLAKISKLASSADRIVEEEYAKPLTAEEKEAIKNRLSENVCELTRLTEDRKNMMDQYKEEMDPLKKESKNMVRDLRHGNRIMNGKLYLYVEGNMVYSYDETGTLISSRRALPGEKQTTINQEMRKADSK